MRHHRRDQFTADMLDISAQIEKETGTTVTFSLAQVNSMVCTIRRSNMMTVEHDELKGFLMARYDFVNDFEWTAYARLLDRIFERRLQAA